MPKMKTKKIVRKRFKLTKNGKVLRRVQGARHLRRNKSKTRQRRQDRMVRVTAHKSEQTVQRLLRT